jgi:hypothetical protein
MKPIDVEKLSVALSLLEERLRIAGAPKIALVVCGGSALIATQLVSRTTKDVDIVALMSATHDLVDPEPLPDSLIQAAKFVAENLNLPTNWLNCEPRNLFCMGLPEGFLLRLIKHDIGPCLTIFFISRLDQIHFKLYASVDRGGYHIDDLMALNPETDELVQAARWSMTHDVSVGYADSLKKLLGELGYGEAAARL